MSKFLFKSVPKINKEKCENPKTSQIKKIYFIYCIQRFLKIRSLFHTIANSTNKVIITS